LEIMLSISIPLTPPDYDQARMIKRPDGFYWQEKLTGEEYGAFSTLLQAIQEMQSVDDDGYGAGELLQEAVEEIGISERIDPQTGEPEEDFQPHLSDE